MPGTCWYSVNDGGLPPSGSLGLNVYFTSGFQGSSQCLKVRTWQVFSPLVHHLHTPFIHSFIHLFSERVLGMSSVRGTGNTDESRSGKHTATGMQSCDRGELWTVERHCLMQSTGLREDSWERHV